MFLGNLSIAKELGSRSGGASASNSSSSSSSKGGSPRSNATGPGSGSSGGKHSDGKHIFTHIDGFEDEDIFTRPCDGSLRLAAKGSKPILYGPGGPDTEDVKLPREIILDYFRDCSALMLDPATLALIVSMGESKGIPLHYAAMEFQRSVMECNFQIEPNFGCSFLSRIPQFYPSDSELMNAAKDFMFTALRSYIEVVRHRSRHFGPLRSSGGLNRSHMMEFFEVCNAKSEFCAQSLVVYTCFPPPPPSL